MESVEQEIYAYIGRAVIASQAFEFVFLLTAKLALKQPDVQTLDEVVPISLSKASKHATKAIVNELKKVGNCPQEERITALIEARHRVVHRLSDEFSWPAEYSETTADSIRSLCMYVTEESMRLSGELLLILVKWLEDKPKLPEFAKFREIAKRMAEQSFGN